MVRRGGQLHSGRRDDAPHAGRARRARHGPLPLARLLPVHRRGRVRRRARVADIIAELEATRVSERITRVIDHDQDGSMEQKKREGYF